MRSTAISVYLVLSLAQVFTESRPDYILGYLMHILCERNSDLNCEYFQASGDGFLRSRWLEGGVFAETRSEFFRCCHLRQTQGILDLKFPIMSGNFALIPVPTSNLDDQYVATFARNFRGAYIDVGSGSAAAVCANAAFPGMGISVEPVVELADKIPSECPNVRVLIGNQNGETNFFEINFRALEAIYGQEPVPRWMLEGSTSLPIFRVLKENAITREVGTFVEDLYFERRSEMATIRSIVELANFSDRPLLLRVRAGGMEPLLMDEVAELQPEIFILSHEYMELLDLAKIVEIVATSPGDYKCAISTKNLFCARDGVLFDQVFFDTRTLLQTLEI